MDGPAALQCRNLTLRYMQPSRSILRLKEDTSGCQPSFRPQTEVPLEHHAYLLPQPEVAPALFCNPDRGRKYFLPQKQPPTVVGGTSRPLFTLPTAVRSTFHSLIHLRLQSEALFISKTASDRSRKHFETLIYTSDRSQKYFSAQNPHPIAVGSTFYLKNIIRP